MPAQPQRARRAIALGVFLITSVIAPSAFASDARYEGISAAGDVAFFSTVDKLVPGDTDTRRDIYVRAFDEVIGGYVTREASFGPTGGNNAFDVQYLAADEAGEKVFFSTAERLTAEDKDNTTDIYVRDLFVNTTDLVSAGDTACLATGCGNANSAVSAVTGGIVADGDRVFFASEERLASEDEDVVADVYLRDLQDETTTLVSPGVGSAPAFFLGASVDGTKALLSTKEALVAADNDLLPDIYQRDLESGQTALVSMSGTCPGVLSCTPVYEGVSSDGAHVFFETNDQIVAGDGDESQDVYDWFGGAVELVSQGSAGGNGEFNALFAGSAADGTQVLFTTDEQLVTDDGDEAQDVYLRSDGSSTALVSEGDPSCPACWNGDFPASLRWVSPDGSTVVLSTAEALLPADQDGSFDVYSRALPGGPTTLASRADSSCANPSCGNGASDANFAAAADGGSHVFFVSEEQLASEDKDSSTDVYDRSGGATTLISSGSINGNGPVDAQLQGASTDGVRAFFVTRERLTDEDDFAAEADVYLRAGTVTLLVSQGNDAELESQLAPPVPQLERTDPESPGESTEPRVIGSEPEAAASIKLYVTADCSGEPVATGAAEQLADPGIAVTVAAGSITSFRATAEAEGFTSACSAALTYQQKSPEPPLPPPGGGGGGGGAGPIVPPTLAPAPPKTRDGLPYVAPVTRITFGPAFKTRARRPVFRFTDSTGQPGTRFLCRLDRGSWNLCGSPTKLKAVARGKHVFQVKGVNAVGMAEEKPVQRAFKLVTQ